MISTFLKLRSEVRRAKLYPELTLLIALVLIGSVAFLFPLTRSVVTSNLDVIPSAFDSGGWALPFFRSMLFGITSAIVSVAGGFILALTIKNCHRAVGLLLSSLLIPILMGSVAVAFCLKLDLFRLGFVAHAIANRSFLPTWTFMLGAQSWPLLALSIYLFWLRLNSVPEVLKAFSVASQLSCYELVRDVEWPFCRNLASVLVIFSTASSFFEYSKVALILRASPGSGIELASHWLLRYYDFYSTVDPVLAVDRCLLMSAVAIIVALLSVVVALFLIPLGLDLLFRFVAHILFRTANQQSPYICTCFAVMILLLALSPISGILPFVNRTNYVPWPEFLRSMILAFACSIVTLAVSILLATGGRLLLKRTLAHFGNRAASLFAIAYLLQLIPGVAIGLCGYFWLSILNNRANLTLVAPILWIGCELIVALPLILSFVQVSHFQVTTAEIEFQESIALDLEDLMRLSFIKRFKSEYLLAGMFAFSMIWTESTINATLSDLSQNIPSVSVLLTQRVDGRGASYGEAANLIIMTLCPVILSLALWTLRIASTQSAVARTRYTLKAVKEA